MASKVPTALDEDEEQFEEVTLLDNSSRPNLDGWTGVGQRPPSKSSGWWQALTGHEPLGRDEAGNASRPTEGKWCPEENCSFYERLFFLFVNSLLTLGSKKALENSDLWDVATKNQAVHVTQKFEHNMQATSDVSKTPHGAVWQSVLKTFFSSWAKAGFLKFVHDFVNLSTPFVLRKLLQHLASDGDRFTGLFWALVLFATGVAVPIMVNQYFLLVFNVGLHVKTALIHTLYLKSLRISIAGRQALGSASISNLQSNDAAKIWNLPQYGHIVWSGPLQVFIIIFSLHLIIGWAPALAGLSVTVFLVPLNTIVGKKVSQLRKELVKRTDARIQLTSEVIIGIKAIKLYAWEAPYIERIIRARAEEQKYIRKTQLLGCINSMLFLGGPIFVAIAAFWTYVHQGNSITADVAFPALAFFDQLRFPIIMLPMQVMNFINARVALHRMQNFINADEIQDQPLSVSATGDEYAASIEGGTFSWEAAGKVVLEDITLKVHAGSLVVIVGEVGCGKTSLLAALLNEMNRERGTVKVRGTVAYTSQDTWIQNGTVESNILMGLPMDEDRYETVIGACALSSDLDMLPAGDQTQIGEKGVSLSGGQKHRVALARACYADSDVYLLDDPLSAVDAHVGRNLFDGCLCGLLAQKTRILVTHQTQYLSQADIIVMMSQGRITAAGTYAELVSQGINFAEFQMDKPAGEEETEDSTLEKTPPVPISDSAAPLVDAIKAVPGDEKGDSAQKSKRVVVKQESSQEDRSKGSVERTVYSSYLKAWGPGYWVPGIFIGAAVFERGFQVTQNYWLTIWSDATTDVEAYNKEVSANADTIGATPELHEVDIMYYMTVYFAFGMTSLLVQSCRSIILVFATLKAATSMHNQLLHKIIRLPMSFFDTQPTGRLLNRFTKDVEACDLSLQQSFNSFTTCSMSVLFSMIVVLAVTRGSIALAIFPMFFLYRSVQQYYLKTSREIKRLDSIAFSPIFSHFGETLSGLLTVRAFRRQHTFADKNELLLDTSNRAYWPIQVVNRWLSIRLELMGQTVVLGTAVVVSVFVRDAGLAGLALTAAMNLVSLMNWTVRQSSELEMSMNSVERLLEYQKYDSELPAIVEGNRPATSWPSKGSIEVRDLVVKYREDLPPVLKAISFSVKGNEKIGICGRTGCGKSTLMMALYRIVEPASGSIKIDGMEVTRIGLFDLRSKLSLVPQDPVIFTGTIRSNLDPFNSIVSDTVAWNALRQAGLEDTIKGMDGKLDAVVSEGGSNMSVGQRQLLCMARALLKQCSILLMDEATSNVDNDTDSLIQTTIRKAFKSCTVLTIAHRLHTIIDSDRILLLDKGNVVEFDEPQTLLHQEGSAFRSLVMDASSDSTTTGLHASPSLARVAEAAGIP